MTLVYLSFTQKRHQNQYGSKGKQQSMSTKPIIEGNKVELDLISR